jgi:hypothetical protein
MKITAKVSYNVIKSFDSGLYVWVDFDELSLLKFSAMRKVLRKPHNFKWDNSTELHTTVLYHTGPMPANFNLIDREIVGEVCGLEAWVDHKDRTIVVACIESPGLQQLHEELKSYGLSHSFPEYKPHATLGCFTGTPSTTEVNDFIARSNKLVSLVDFSICYQPCIYGDSLC